MSEIDLRRADPVDIPRRLALAHRTRSVGSTLTVRWPDLDDTTRADLVTGAGFAGSGTTLQRQRTLPDTVGPALRLLVCGLNPSLHAADAGVGFVTPSNRFWRAALAAGLVTETHDPWHALDVDRVGMTDLVKRATARAAELRTDEYRTGCERVARLCELLQPAAVVFVGLSGWRAAVDRHAAAGWQPAPLGAAPVYLMPSTSGLNAATSLDALTSHLAAAAAITES